MALDIYWEGYEAGAATASLMPASVKTASACQDLGVLAGLKLNSAIKRNQQNGGEDRYFRTRRWQEGFFDGFMSKGEEIQKAL